MSREASFEEVQEARNFLVEQYTRHEPSRESIELALDAILQASESESELKAWGVGVTLLHASSLCGPVLRLCNQARNRPAPGSSCGGRASLMAILLGASWSSWGCPGRHPAAYVPARPPDRGSCMPPPLLAWAGAGEDEGAASRGLPPAHARPQGRGAGGRAADEVRGWATRLWAQATVPGPRAALGRTHCRPTSFHGPPSRPSLNAAADLATHQFKILMTRRLARPLCSLWERIRSYFEPSVPATTLVNDGSVFVALGIWAAWTAAASDPTLPLGGALAFAAWKLYDKRNKRNPGKSGFLGLHRSAARALAPAAPAAAGALHSRTPCLSPGPKR